MKVLFGAILSIAFTLFVSCVVIGALLLIFKYVWLKLWVQISLLSDDDYQYERKKQIQKCEVLKKENTQLSLKVSGYELKENREKNLIELKKEVEAISKANEAELLRKKKYAGLLRQNKVTLARKRMINNFLDSNAHNLTLNGQRLTSDLLLKTAKEYGEKRE